MIAALLEQAGRFAAESNACMRALKVCLTDWELPGREGIDRTDTLERANRYLRRATELHGLEHSARQLAAMELSEVDACRAMFLLGDFVEERSAGFESGLEGTDNAPPFKAGRRSEAWRRGYADGAEVRVTLSC